MFKPKNPFFRERALCLAAIGGKMAPFGDGGGGGEDEGGGDARTGWDPLRSGSAPPTMDGGAATALAAEGLFGGGGGAGSFFSGMGGGLGARLHEVSRRPGVGAQVGDVLNLSPVLVEVFGFFAL